MRRNAPRPRVVRRDLDDIALLAAVAERGSPLVEPDPRDPSAVIATWVWVDDPAAPADWVYLDANGITDRQWLNEGQLRRIRRSNVWALSLRVPARWRGTYSLIPGHGRLATPVDDDPDAERRWWLGVLDGAIPDPLNDGRVVQPMRGGRGSEAVMPAAPLQLWWPPPAGDAPAFVAHEVDLLGRPRTVWTTAVGPDHGGAADLAVCFDGQVWASTMPIAAGLGRLGATLERRLAVALVDSVDTATRAVDLTCSPPFRSAVCDVLVPWLRTEHGATDDPNRSVVAGQSFGGLAAVDLVLERPDVFANAISQSGSFWWPGHGSAEPSWIWDDRLREHDRRGVRLWLEAGALETEMDELTRRFTLEAASHGAQIVHRGTFCGGHDVVHWRNGLVDGLATLLGTP